jgi:hypothetical protein
MYVYVCVYKRQERESMCECMSGCEHDTPDQEDVEVSQTRANLRQVIASM